MATLSKWDERFINQAKEVSTWSKDPSTQCGSIIAQGKKVISQGFNGFPECVPDHPYWYDNKTFKYPLVIHAEENAFNQTTKDKVVGGTIYNYPYSPCGKCAIQIAGWGIKRVVAPIGRKEYEDEAKFVFKRCVGIEFILVAPYIGGLGWYIEEFMPAQSHKQVSETYNQDRKKFQEFQDRIDNV